jgi:hypothetical protein
VLAPLAILRDIPCRDRPDLPALAQDCHQELGATLCVRTSFPRVVEELSALPGIPLPQDPKRNRFLSAEWGRTRGPDATPGVYLLQLGTSERHLVLPGATSPSQR